MDRAKFIISRFHSSLDKDGKEFFEVFLYIGALIIFIVSLMFFFFGIGIVFCFLFSTNGICEEVPKVMIGIMMSFLVMLPVAGIMFCMYYCLLYSVRSFKKANSQFEYEEFKRKNTKNI